MNNDYLDYLAHYRTPGAVNGVSHTPGYDAVGKPAMSEAERIARKRMLAKKYMDTTGSITRRGVKKYKKNTADLFNKNELDYLRTLERKWLKSDTVYDYDKMMDEARRLSKKITGSNANKKYKKTKYSNNLNQELASNLVDDLIRRG